MAKRLSSRRWLLAGIIGATLLAVAAQIVNTRAVRNRLCDYAANESGCAASMSLGAVELSLPNGQPGAARAGPSELHASTWLLRRTCDGRWTFALGARVEADRLVLGSGGRTFEIPHGCLFTDRRRLDGRVDEAHLVVDGCRIRLAPFQFSAATALNASITATMDPATVQRCARLLPAGVGQLASTAIRDTALNVTVDYRAPASSGAFIMPLIRDAAAAGGPARVLSTISTSHRLEAAFAGAKTTVRLDTQPTTNSATVRLRVHADAPIAAQLPLDMRPAAGQPADLDLQWLLNHEAGVVRINGIDKRRRPLQPSRGTGRVYLSASECGTPAASGARTLYFVEAGDDGLPLRPEQLAAVLADVGSAVPNPGAIVTVFVHGWQHSGAVDDSYVCRFSDVLASVEQMETTAARLSRRQARRIIGVYVGWPGALYDDDLVNSATTFWNRLGVADKLGARESVLRRLIAETGQRLTPGRVGARADLRSSLVVVGHSMGARAVFTALRDDLVASGGANGAMPAAPDVVLLVNPAFSAELYRSIHERTRECRPGQAPMLLFSSIDDGVTRQVYPAGQAVTYPYASAEAAPLLEHIHTAANFGEFVTHRLTLEPIDGAPPDPDGPQTILRGFERVPVGSRELYADNPVTVYRQPAAGRPRADDAWYRLRLTEVGAPRACASAASASAVVAVDARVIPDHGRIFTPPFVEYIVRVLNTRALSGGIQPAR